MEQLKLERHDLVQTGATRRGTLLLLPAGSDKTQKVAVADLSGVVQSFSAKRLRVKTHFKSFPNGNPVTAIAAGRGASQRDRLFVADRAAIRGFTKKGKEFFKFDANLTESVNGLVVSESLLVVLGEYSCTVFEDGKERSFYMSPDRINAIESLSLHGELRLLLACQDRSVRCVIGSAVAESAATLGAATCIVRGADEADPSGRQPSVQSLLYGTESGVFGQLFLERDGLRHGFVVENADGRGGVSALLARVDFTKDGAHDVAVGRDDGYVEIYSTDETDTLCRVFETRLPDRINTLAGGFVISVSARDLVVQTYSGKIIAYVPEGYGALARRSEKGPAAGSPCCGEEKLGLLNHEIAELRGQTGALLLQIKERKERLAQLSEGVVDDGLNVRQSCRLNAENGHFALTIEADKPIFCVALRSDVHLELLPLSNGVAILNLSTTRGVPTPPILATFRCQESANRLEVPFRRREGEAGLITCFVFSKYSPRTAFVVRQCLLPLCYHERGTDGTDNVGGSVLRLRGDFGDEELCRWFSAALPDFPREWPSERGIIYRNGQSGNVLRTCKEGSDVVVQSEDVRVLDVLRETLLKEARRRHWQLTAEFDPDLESLRRAIKALWEDVQTHQRAKEQASLASAFLELRQQEASNLVDPKLQALLQDAAELQEQRRAKSERMDRMSEDLHSLLALYRKLSGANAPLENLERFKLRLQEPDFTLASFYTI